MRRHRLVAGVRRFGERSGQKRGQKVGPNPTDRGKSGYKRHLLTDASGLPLTVVPTAANVHDPKVFEQLLDAVPPIKPSARGRPRNRPNKLHADKGYDFPHCRRALHKRGIRVRIARRGKDSSRRLGRHRWVIERTLAWLSSYLGLRSATNAGRICTKPSCTWHALWSASVVGYAVESSFRDLTRASLPLRAVGPSEGWSCPRDGHGWDVWEVLPRGRACI
jgi:transposase